MENKEEIGFTVQKSVSFSPITSEKRIKSLSDLLKSVLHCKIITDCEDVLMEIVMGLPIKDLLRLKCVSKQYRRMISDPLFGYLYYQHNPGTNLVAGLLLYHLGWPFNSSHNFVFLNEQQQTPPNPFGSLSAFDANFGIHRIWSCNGLLCLWISNPRISICDFYICNPTTYNSIRLPDLTRPPKSRIESMIIAFDPQKSPFYKVVCIWIHMRRYRFSIYSSESKGWRHTDTYLEVKLDDSYLFKKGVFWNNSLHWISRRGPFLRFDMDKECLEKMPTTNLPNSQAKRSIQYFGVSGGHLYLVEKHDGEHSVLEISEMQRDYSRWLLRYRVDLNQLFRLPPGFGEYFKFSIHWILRLENRDDLFGLVLSTISGTISMYFSAFSSAFCATALLIERPRLLHQAMDMIQFKWYRSHQFITTLIAV